MWYDRGLGVDSSKIFLGVNNDSIVSLSSGCQVVDIEIFVDREAG